MSPLCFFLTVPLIWSYCICYFGNEATIHYESINVSVYMCDWYLFPLKMQKCLPFMMIVAQKPIYIGSFGKTRCNRATFQRVSTIIYRFQL